MQTKMRWHGVVILLVAVVASPPRTVLAANRADTLRRAVGNVLLGPIDVALSPAVTAKAMYDNGQAANYSPAAIGALGVIGGAGWYFPITAAAGILRIWSGFIEMPIGLVLLVSKSFTKWEPGPIFEVTDKPAMVSYPNAPIPIVFGVNYPAGT